ncbi:MAG: prealbumin-like fold domain-containing protein [Ruminococcus sp.]
MSSEGTVDFKNLYLGNYFVKEIEPAEGYLLDETEYPVEVSYEGQEVQIVHREVTVKETVKKQALSAYQDLQKTGEQTETELVEGAGFKVFLISELSGVKRRKFEAGKWFLLYPGRFYHL